MSAPPCSSRVREYTDLADVERDFGLSSAAYLEAAALFARPLPDSVMLGDQEVHLVIVQTDRS